MVHAISTLRPTPLLTPVTHRPGRGAVSNTPTSTTSIGPTTTSDPAADFRALFTPKIPANTPPGYQPAPQQAAPTAESVFGPNPWLTNPTGVGPNGQGYGYNNFYFATPETAAKVAQMVGGTVVQSNEFTGNGGQFTQSQPNQMVKMPDGRLINPGLVASFYTHGYPQSYIDQMIANEVKG